MVCLVLAAVAGAVRRVEGALVAVVVRHHCLAAEEAQVRAEAVVAGGLALDLLPVAVPGQQEAGVALRRSLGLQGPPINAPMPAIAPLVLYAMAADACRETP